jgi:glycosyltransferase involved in cell wall biosynthesis
MNSMPANESRLKKIWIVNFHTAPPEFVTQPRYLKLIPYLQAAGFDVTIISQGYLRRHKLELVPANKQYIEKQYNGYKYIHIKSIKYAGNGLGRMFAIFLFSLKLFFFRNKFDKPDIIYHNIHMPFDFPVYLVARKLKVSYIVEAWDLWPEFFHTMGLMNKKNPIMKIAYYLEKFVYSKAEKIVFTFSGGKKYIEEKKWDLSNGGTIDLSKIEYLTNGVDLEEFESNALNYPTNDPDLMIADDFKVLYVGSINLANNLQQLLDAALLLRDNSRVKFFIYGDGSERAGLEAYVAQNEITNVNFKDKKLPFSHLPAILKMSNLNIMNYQKGFGDYGISPGKLALYLASGRPILSNTLSYDDIIQKYRLGFSNDIKSASEYSESILKLSMMSSSDYSDMCSRVRSISNNIDYKLLSDKLIGVFE